MARLFADLPRGARRHARRWPSGSSSRWRISATGFPTTRCPTGETQASFLRRLAEVGARDRYRPYHDRARAQIARELDLIEKLDLAGYFLIVWDIVNFCRQQDILVQGRGSAANSAVCYASGSRRSIRSAWICCSSGSSPRSAASGRTSISICRAAIGASGHPVRLRALRRARRGDDGQRHHVPRPQRGARGGQGAGVRGRRASIGSRRSMTPFEFERPGARRWRVSSADAGLDAERSARPAVRRPVAADPGSAAASRPALGRHGDVPGPARRGRAARARHDARPRRRAVGQGRLRRPGHRQGRPAGPRHDGGAAGGDCDRRHGS